MIEDKYFKVNVINAIPHPQWTSLYAAKQDYSAEYLGDKTNIWKITEKEAGESKAIQKCLKRGHFGIFEHPQLVFNVGYFPHDVMVQARTHRTGISFDCMSQRYTSQHIVDIIENKKDVEEVFYFRPSGHYDDRMGHKYDYTEKDRQRHIENCLKNCQEYYDDLKNGFAPEHIRHNLNQNIRQHFVVSMNLRTLMHFISLRYKKDAQWEIQQLSYLLNEHFKNYAPQIGAFYEEKIMKRQPMV